MSISAFAKSTDVQPEKVRIDFNQGDVTDFDVVGISPQLAPKYASIACLKENPATLLFRLKPLNVGGSEELIRYFDGADAAADALRFKDFDTCHAVEQCLRSGKVSDSDPIRLDLVYDKPDVREDGKNTSIPAAGFYLEIVKLSNACIIHPEP